MDPRLITPPAPGSPWASWARPDIRHCEANLSGWIAAPCDSWSNLAYAAVGVWLLARGRGPARALGAIALAVGATSFAFHASYTAVGQGLDYAGMFLLTGWLLSRGDPRRWAAAFAASLFLYIGFLRLGWPVQSLMLVQVPLIVVLEARAPARGRRPLFVAVGLVAAAYACWHLDHSDAFCRPDDHLFQWHAAWHLLTALAFLPLARSYEDDLTL